MPDQLTRQVKEQRARALIREGEILRQQYEETLIGCPCEILIEEVIAEDGKNFLAGYTPEYVRILVPWEGEDIPGNRFLQVTPVQFEEGTLFGR
jgi:threonylcarbamoyladenosine tRNA methylthiotransferase MtaB